MNKKIPIITFIGKPNNGKSSMISALTMNDKIEISSEIGTTKVANTYLYQYNNNDICRFYDTPGFEQAPEIINFLNKNSNNNTGGLDLFTLFQDDKKNDSSFSKDIEILKAIKESNIIIFVINISEKFDMNEFGYELDIIKFIKNNGNNKLLKICFNKISKDIHEVSWKKEFPDLEEHIFAFNPLKNSFRRIQYFYKKLGLEESNPEIIETYKKNFEQNIESTVDIIINGLVKLLRSKKYSKKDEDSLKENKILFSEELIKIEKEIQNEVSRKLGYYRIVVMDKRDEFFHDRVIVETSLDPSQKALLYGGTLATVSAIVTGTLSGGLGAPAGAVLGGAVGLLYGYLKDISLFSVGTSIFKKDALFFIGEKDFDFTHIMIMRLLSFSVKLINHGHANRITLEISNDDLEKYELNKDEIKKFNEIHKSFINDSDIQKNKEELKKILKKILETKVYSYV